MLPGLIKMPFGFITGFAPLPGSANDLERGGRDVWHHRPRLALLGLDLDVVVPVGVHLHSGTETMSKLIAFEQIFGGLWKVWQPVELSLIKMFLDGNLLISYSAW